MRKTVMAVMLGLLGGGAQWAQANCTQTVAVRSASPIVVNLTTPLSTSTSWNSGFSTAYPDSFTCSLGTVIRGNRVTNSSAYSQGILSSGLVINFNNGESFLTVKVSSISPGNVNLDLWEATYPGSRVNATFNLTVTRSSTNPGGIYQVSATGNSYTIPNIVQAGDTTGQIWTPGQLLGDLWTFITTGRWPSRESDIYYQPLTIFYNLQPTTCETANPAQVVTLPPVDRAQLRNNIEGGEKNFNIALRCQNQYQGNTNRGLKVYLTSNNLSSTDQTLLVGDSSSTANGVGIKLSKQDNTTPLSIGVPGGLSANSSLLLEKKLNDQLDSMVYLGLTARYHAYDPANLTAGSINTTAIVNFEYE